MRPTIFLPLALLMTACAREAPQAPAAASVRDSAGIQIVSSTAPAWGEHSAWRIADRLSLELGGVAGDAALDFVNVLGARRLPDGAIVVANGLTAELRWFSPEGKPLRTIGGRGTAPGQFAALSGLFSLGDTLLTWDDRARRLSRYSLSGDLLRVDTLRLTDSARSFTVLGVLADGSVLAEADVLLELGHREPGIIRPGKSLFRLRADGHADSIGVVPGEELYFTIRDSSATLYGLPFAQRGRLVALADGYLVSEGDRLQLEEHGANGRLKRILRWPGARVPVASDDTARQLRTLLGSARSGIQRKKVESVWRGLPVPDSFPAIVGLAADPGSLVWVRRGGHLGDPTEAWTVLGKDGVWLGTLALAAGAAPLDLSPDWIVLLAVDSERVERVQVRRIRR